MAIHLHHTLTLPLLDKISEDRSTAEERCLYCMRQWLDSDVDACWPKVVSALRVIEKHQLAKELESRYCAVSVGAPSRACIELADASVSPRESQARPQSLQMPPFHGDTASSSEATPFPVVEPFVLRNVDELERVVKGYLDLEEQFVSLVTHVQFYFSEKAKESESPKFLGMFRLTLINLPMSRKFKHMHFLGEKKQLISAAQDIGDIFNILSPYWNHVDYSLLEHITMEFGSQDMKKRVKVYITSLIKFEKVTTIQIFIDATYDDRKIPPEFNEVIIKLDRKPSECTLYDIRRFKESLACRSSLNAYSVQLKRLGVGSVVVVLAVPGEVVDMLIEAAEQFQLEVGSHILSVKRTDSAEHVIASQKSAVVEVRPTTYISAQVEGTGTRLSLRSADSGISSSSSRSLLTPKSLFSLFSAALCYQLKTPRHAPLPTRSLSHTDISLNDLPNPAHPVRRTQSLPCYQLDQASQEESRASTQDITAINNKVKLKVIGWLMPPSDHHSVRHSDRHGTYHSDRHLDRHSDHQVIDRHSSHHSDYYLDRRSRRNDPRSHSCSEMDRYLQEPAPAFSRNGHPSQYLSHNDIPKVAPPMRGTRSAEWARNNYSNQLPSEPQPRGYHEPPPSEPREPEPVLRTPGEGETDIIDKILLEAVGCLMHQENCQIQNCPCKQVKKRFQHLLPQARILHQQEEANTTTKEVQSGNIDPTDRRQQLRLSFSSQQFNKDIHPHYHMTSHSHIRQSKGSQRFIQRRRSKSMDLTPVIEQPESCATTPGVIVPDSARGLLCGLAIFSPAVTPSEEKIRVLSPTTPSSSSIAPPVLLREISLSADNFPSLCLNDSPMAATPLTEQANRPLGHSPLLTTQYHPRESDEDSVITETLC